jgi:hypothetical protein
MGLYSNYTFFYGFVSEDKTEIIKKISYSFHNFPCKHNNFDHIVDEINFESKSISTLTNENQFDWYVLEESSSSLDIIPCNWIVITKIINVPTGDDKETIILSPLILQRIQNNKEINLLSKKLQNDYKINWNIKYDNINILTKLRKHIESLEILVELRNVLPKVQIDDMH